MTNYKYYTKTKLIEVIRSMTDEMNKLKSINEEQSSVIKQLYNENTKLKDKLNKNKIYKKMCLKYAKIGAVYFDETKSKKIEIGS